MILKVLSRVTGIIGTVEAERTEYSLHENKNEAHFYRILKLMSRSVKVIAVPYLKDPGQLLQWPPASHQYPCYFAL